MNAFSTPWLNLSIGITMGYSLDQLPGNRRGRLPTEPGIGDPTTSTWDSATPSSSNAALGSSSVTASLGSMNNFNSLGGYASPLAASPIKSPPVAHHHIDIGDELDPHKSKICCKCSSI